MKSLKSILESIFDSDLDNHIKKDVNQVALFSLINNWVQKFGSGYLGTDTHCTPITQDEAKKIKNDFVTVIGKLPRAKQKDIKQAWTKMNKDTCYAWGTFSGGNLRMYMFKDGTFMVMSAWMEDPDKSVSGHKIRVNKLTTTMDYGGNRSSWTAQWSYMKTSDFIFEVDPFIFEEYFNTIVK